MGEYEDAKKGYSQFNIDIIDYIISVSREVDSYEKIKVYYKE